MKDIDEYKESGVPWIGEVPKDWQIPVLKRTTYIKGRIGWQGLTSEEYRSDGKYHLITGTDFDNGKIRWERCWYVDKARYLEDENIQLCEDDVLITKDGTIGKIAIVENMPSKATLNSGVFVTRPFKKQYLQRFMFWVLNSDLFPEFIEYSKVGTTIAHLYQKTFERFIYPLPSLSEQRRITAYLDKTCSAIDVAIETKRKQLETLDALRKSIIHKTITRGLDDSVELKDSGVEWIGKIPKHWKVEHLKRSCLRIQTGTTPPTANKEYYVDGTIPWFAPGCYDGGIYLEGPAKLINEIAYHDNKLRLFPAHSIFLVGIGATIGKVAMIKTDASCNQQITGIVCNSDVSSKYFTYQLKVYEGIIPQISQYTTLPIMDQVKIGYLRAVLPPLREQDEIASFLDTKTSEILELKINLHDQIKTLEQYRKSLIHECVTGKRRITDNDLKQIEAKLN